MDSINYKKVKEAVFAALAIAASFAEANTIAWYHFDEVAPGTRLISGDSILNAVDANTFRGAPYSVGTPGTTDYATLGSLADYMPLATNGIGDAVYVVDPIGGTTNRNERSLFFTYADNGSSPARYGGCVQVQSSSALSLADVTVEFFVMPMRLTGSTGNTWILVAKQSSAVNKFTYSICINSSGKPYVNCYNSSGTIMDTTGSGKFAGASSILDGRWHHIAFTVNGTDAKLYIDYTLAASTNLTESLAYNDTAPLYIGGSRNDSGKSGGIIDEVRISDLALEPNSFLRYVHPGQTQFYVDFDGSANSESSYGTVTGTLGKYPSTGSTPTYSASEVPNERIVDGLGTLLRKDNASSLRFSKSSATYPHNPDLEMTEMTVEFFLKHESADGYAGLLRFNKSNTNWGTTPIWNIGYDSTGGQLNMRVDTTAASNQGRAFGNTFLDGQWHHVAVTFQQGETELTVRVYDNYKQVGEDWTIDGMLDYSKGSCLGIGYSSASAGFTGWLDEVRISRGILPVEAFMRAVHKPGMIIAVR